jgi:hypothetical protein
MKLDRLDPQALSWSFGDPTGWVIAGGFFLVLSIGIGWLVYGISYRLLARGGLGLRDRLPRWPRALLGTVVALGIFVLLYASSLRGFSRLDYRHGQLTIHYLVPARSAVLGFIQVMNIQEAPAFKGRWRLVLITDVSGSYESALASRDDVHQAAEWLRREMRQLSSAPR